MPAFYLFKTADGTPITLKGVDRIVCDILGVAPNPAGNNGWYEVLTWAVLVHSTFGKIAEAPGMEPELVQIAKGLEQRGVTYIAGRTR